MISGVADPARPGGNGRTDPVTAETEDLTVEKSASLYEDDVFTVTFTIRSTSEAPVAVELTDRCPEENGPVEFGFHPDYDPDAWRVLETGGVRYETVLDPGEERVTVYGFRVTAKGFLGWLLEPPLVRTDRLGDGEDDPDPDGSDRRADVGDGPAGGDGTPGSAAPAMAEPLAEPSDGPPVSDGIEYPNGARAEHDDTAHEDYLSAVLSALRDRELTDEERALLRGRLGLEGDGSVSARLRHVQQRVDDLLAYRDALEAFIDENGDPPAVVDRLADRVDALGHRLEEIEGRLDATTEELRSLETEHDGAVERLDEQYDAVRSDLAEAREELTADLETLRADVDRGMAWRERVGEATRSPSVPEG